MIVADERPSVGVLDPFKLEPAYAVEFAAMGDGVLDRRELQKVVRAFSWTVEQQQH